MNKYSFSCTKICEGSKLLNYLLKTHYIVSIYSRAFPYKIIASNLMDEDTNS